MVQLEELISQLYNCVDTVVPYWLSTVKVDLGNAEEIPDHLQDSIRNE